MSLAATTGMAGATSTLRGAKPALAGAALVLRGVVDAAAGAATVRGPSPERPTLFSGTRPNTCQPDTIVPATFQRHEHQRHMPPAPTRKNAIAAC